jgi:hypothetical protein
VLAGSTQNFTATWTDVNQDDTFETTWDWGDGSPDTVNSSATSPDSETHAFAAPGFYTVTFTVEDSTGRSDSASMLVIVYKPSAGHVTGSGTYAGTNSFNLSAKYNPSGTTVNGSTTFTGPGFTFASTSTDWLVISGNTGTYSGSGTYNGDAGYTYLVSVVDGGSPSSADRVRFQVTDEDGAVVYDTQPGDPIGATATTPLTSGNVTVHKGK